MSGNCPVPKPDAALQRSALAFINGKTGPGQLDTQFEIDQVVFAGQFPVRQRSFRKRGIRPAHTHHHVIGRRLAARHVLVREIRQRHDHGVQLFAYGPQPLLHAPRAFLQLNRFRLSGFGLLLFALFEQHTHFLGDGILLRQACIQLSLNRFTFIVQRFDLLDGLCGIHPLDVQTFQRKRLVFPDLLKCQHLVSIFLNFCILLSFVFT